MIRKIIQLGDIHILKNEKHKEYKAEFKRLFTSIKNSTSKIKYDEKIIVLTGDIYDKWTDISNEAVDTTAFFLQGLAKIAKVYIIKGNHDVNSNNQEHIDIISLVCSLLNNDNIILLDSSPAEFSNMVLCPFNIQNNNNRPVENGGDIIDKYKNSDKKVIGIYHGPIQGVKTYRAQNYDNYKLSTKLFEGCDAVLMGDIHIPQVLENNDTVCVYNGSLFQKGFGESIHKHGYFIWDVDVLKYKFKEFKTKRKYVKIGLDSFDGIEKNEEYIINTFPDDKYNIVADENYLYRLIWTDYSANITPKRKNELKKQFSKKWGVPLKNITIRTEIIFQGANMNNISYKLLTETKDLKNVEETYRKYLKQHYFDITDEEVNDFIFFNKDIEKKLNVEYKVTNERKRYEILWIGGDNFLSFGEFERNFNNKINLISSEPGNMGGKSNLIRAVAFMLFGSLYYDGDSKRSTLNEIFNIYSKKNKVIIQGIVKIDEKKYFFSRGLSRRYSEELGDWDVSHKFNLYEFVDIDATYFISKKDTYYTISKEGIGVKKLTKNNNPETLKYINEKIGSIKDFYFVSVFTNSNIQKWLGFKPTARLEMFYKYLGLEVLDMKYNYIKDLYNDYVKNSLSGKYDTLELNSKISLLKADIDEYEQNLNKKNKKIKSADQAITSVKEDIRKLEQTKIPIEQYKFTTEEVKEKIIKLNEKITELELQNFETLTTYKLQSFKDEHIIKCEKLINKYSVQSFKEPKDILSKINDLKNQLDSIDSNEEIVSKKKEKKQISEKIIQLKGQLSSNKETTLLLKEELSTLTKDIVCDNCNTIVVSIEDETKKLDNKISKCNATISQIEKDLSFLKEKEKVLSAEILNITTGYKTKIETQISLVENKLKDLRTEFDDKKRKKLQKYNAIVKNLNSVKQNLYLIESAKEKKQSFLEIKNKIENQSNIVSKNNNIDFEISKFKEVLMYQKSLKDNALKSKMEIEFNLKKAKEEYNKLNDVALKIKNERKLETLYERYKEVHNKKSLPSDIISNVLPTINEYLREFLKNDKLEPLDDFSSEMKFNGNELEFYITRGDKVYKLDRASGFEQTMCIMALHGVFMMISTLPMNNILTLDEVFGTVYKNNLDKLYQIFLKLRPLYGTIDLVSHNEVIAQLAENNIRIVKQNKISKILN